jgi:class 3 adenylate cyclase
MLRSVWRLEENKMILPSGTVTFLFTDIEGSTRLAREHPERWERLRARHHAIVREAIECYQGYVFQIRRILSSGLTSLLGKRRRQ